jgi:hypothetical protein
MEGSSNHIARPIAVEGRSIMDSIKIRTIVVYTAVCTSREQIQSVMSSLVGGR